MRSTWTCFLLSILSLITGFTLVLIFTIRYVVPTISDRAVVRTQCYVEAVDLYSTRTGAPQHFTIRNISTSALHFQINDLDSEDPVKVIDIQKAAITNVTRTHSTNDLFADLEGLNVLPKGSCPVVTVSYSLQDGRRRKGYLYQRGSSPVIDTQLNVTNKVRQTSSVH